MKRKVFLAAMALMLLAFAPALTACGTDDDPVAENPAVPTPNPEQPGDGDNNGNDNGNDNNGNNKEENEMNRNIRPQHGRLQCCCGLSGDT